MGNDKATHFENKAVKVFFKAWLIACKEDEFKGKIQHGVLNPCENHA